MIQISLKISRLFMNFCSNGLNPVMYMIMAIDCNVSACICRKGYSAHVIAVTANNSLRNTNNTLYINALVL